MQESFNVKTREILGLIIQNSSLETICSKTVETLDIYFSDSRAAVLLFDQETKTYCHVAGSELPETFYTNIERLECEPEADVQNTVPYLEKPNIITAAATDILSEKDLKTRLKSYRAFPIMSANNKILGTIAICGALSTEATEDEEKHIGDMAQLLCIAIENNYKNKTIEKNRVELEDYAQKLEQKVQERTREIMATAQTLLVSNLKLEDQIRLAQLAENEALSNKNIASKIAKNFPNGFVAVMNERAQIMFAEGDALLQLGLKAIFKEGMYLDDISFFSQGRKQKIKENIKRNLSGEHLSFEIKYKKRYFAVNTAPLVDKNNVIANVLHVYNDISKHKEIEFAMQNALKPNRN